MKNVDQVLDILEDVLSGVVGYGFRTVGLIIIFAMGAGGVVAALGINATAAQQLRERLTAAALDQLTVRPVPSADLLPADEPSPVSLPEDAERRLLRINDVQSSARSWTVPGGIGPIRRTGSLDGGSDVEVAGTVIGTSGAVLDVFSASVSPPESRLLLDEPTTPAIAIVGDAIARSLDLAAPGPGVRVIVGHVPVEVVGIITDAGRAPVMRDAILVPRSLALMLSDGNAEEALYVRTRPGRAFAVSRVLPAVLQPDHPSMVAVEQVPDLRNLRRGVGTDLDSTAGLLAVVMLTLAGITTMSIMTLSVSERTPEIALRRAVGISRERTGLTFLLEGSLIGLIGGVIGVAAGVVAVFVAANQNGWSVALPSWLPVVGLGCGLSVGVVAAARASIKAASVQPALAIRR